MTFHDNLAADYGDLCDRLSRRFGTVFEIASTGGGCYAIAATLETGDLLLITDANDATLNTLQDTEGFGVGVYEDTDAGNTQRVYIADASASVDALPDLVATALHIRATEGTYIEGWE